MGRPGSAPADGPPDSGAVEAIFRAERGRILATLIRLVGDFDLAEEALQDALAAALAQWPRDGAPGQPRAWLVGTARHKALDRLRRHSLDRRTGRALEAALQLAGGGEEPALDEPSDLPDDRLRLIFTCCHPALAIEAQVALTLRAVCGLTTEEIARAFLVHEHTLAKRIARAKHKLVSSGVPYRVP